MAGGSPGGKRCSLNDVNPREGRGVYSMLGLVKPSRSSKRSASQTFCQALLHVGHVTCYRKMKLGGGGKPRLDSVALVTVTCPKHVEGTLRGMVVGRMAYGCKEGL